MRVTVIATAVVVGYLLTGGQQAFQTLPRVRSRRQTRSSRLAQLHQFRALLITVA